MPYVHRDNLTEKEKEYYAYVEKHVNTVTRSWKLFKKHKLAENLLKDETLLLSIETNVQLHDLSKLHDYEFDGYRQWFFPYANIDKNQDLFLQAWNHHQKLNKHHWQYWVLPRTEENTILEMPVVYAVEMLLDWTAMSFQFDNLPSDWYQENKASMQLHDNTKIFIEKWLPVFDRVYHEMKASNVDAE